MSTQNQPPTLIPAVIMTCGLPASGKTTTAMRLHAHLGGVLIRSCDVYQELGIVLSEWVERTHGFTVKVAEYDRLRDEAYCEMATRVDTGLAAGATVVIVDAVHGERDKRRRLYEVCAARGAQPVLVLCLCGDFEEVRRRFRARRGRETEPQHEASDLSVFYDIGRRWQSPLTDELLDGTRPTIFTYDTLDGRVAAIHIAMPAAAERIRAALVTPRSGATRALPLR
ncbi:MAG: ATP-binding protein [candidate division NC10 bacterium]|nr:ATP-binding protein [candidate division NC10 bacterium]